MSDYLGDGIYRIGKAERIWSCRKAIMDDAVAEVEPGIPPSNARFGWFKGAIPTPPTGGFYVVEFLDDQQIRVLAYVDMYGRAFTTETGFERPPAKPQDLFIALSENSLNKGTIFARGEDGNPIALASFLKSGSGQNAKYTIGETWYDFKNHRKNLHYYDLMTRAYLAFIYRPTLGKATLPFGIDDVYRTLSQNELLPALNEVIARVGKAEADQLVTVHPAVSKLSQRLVSAGVPTLAAENENCDLRLIRTTQYADTFFIQNMNDSSVPETTIWEIEAALNLFSLTESLLQFLQSKGELASLVGCESYLLESAASQSVNLELANSLPEGRPAGEWQIRSRIAAGIENMALPIRVEAYFTLDLPKGLVRFMMRVPDSQLMAALFDKTTEEAAVISKRYAMQIGLLLVDIAMRASSRIEQVDLIAHTIGRDKHEDAELFAASFNRDNFEHSAGFEEGRKADPSAIYESMSGKPSDDVINSNPTAFSKIQNELSTIPSPEIVTAWGAKTYYDLEIFFDAELRLIAERIADAIADAADTSDAVAKVRQIQEETLVQNTFSHTAEAFTRLLKALAEGAIDTHEQNTTVNCFLGEDECMRAYQHCEALCEAEKLDEAIQILTDAITRFENTNCFTDSEKTVYRVFDSYAARLVYNQVKSGAILISPDSAIFQDKGKETRLAPDSYSFCLFKLASLLCANRQIDKAVHYAMKMIQVAPTTNAGYQILGRIYVLQDDFVNACTVFKHALVLMTSPDDIAILYYHLAYALWKSGDPGTALACYIKSLQTSSIASDACISEIEELQKETALPLPPNESINAQLEQAGVPIMPSESVQTILEEAAIAALDDGLFDAARSLLSFVFNYRKDDALAGILRSLDFPFRTS